MSSRVTAEERLSRILYLLPAAAREGGASVAELAAALGVSEEEVLRDVAEVTSREFYHPAGSGAEIQVRIEHGRIHVWTTGDFRRPVRLTPRETLALGLGLRALAIEAEPERRDELLALATRLESALAVPAVESRAPMDAAPSYMPDAMADVEREADEFVASRALSDDGSPPPSRSRTPTSDSHRLAAVLADDDEDIFSVVVEAARARRACRIRYLKAGAALPEDREVHAYHLAHAEGRWYLIAHCVARDGMRIFRLDRILAAELLTETFEVPADFDPARYIAEGGRLFFAESDVEVAVRYSPRIARWIEERTACETRDDGSVVVRHRVADARWVVRHVLQYGAEAEVLEPAEVRGMVGRVAERLCG